MGENTFVTFWQDQCVGVRDIVEYCHDFFNYFLYRLVLINCDARDVTKILRYLPDPTRRLSIAYYGRFVSQYMRISLQRLRSFDIPSIHLTHSGITCFDLNAFLRYWQQGGSRRTKCLDIMLSRVNFDILFHETRAVERGQDVTRKYKDDDIDITITGGYDIRRNGDGRLATCGYWADNSFKMFVWRRNQNR
ncbi:hypothetical protein CAEBREN_20399 [Caenorhabditis brenneri]|uniref:Sdz-33 F-box domain-containing protein n=1 Tax=Caenorhabditis brenneri TaxID=135651 RepID=G0MGG2_CAEBE|nr:hypothetical protein CAEBREN_20399 [Caenorhabditis brenneri]